MPLLNDFLLGADPEFVILDGNHVRQFVGTPEPDVPWGLDHSNWVIEPHPKPELSVRKLLDNLKISFNDFATVAPAGKWRAGAWVQAPERTITLGGHVHVDKPACSQQQRNALDLFTEHLEKLDILPETECIERRKSQYGRYGDIRIEHGHFEYRTMPSWLFSQRVTKLCLIGTKLAMIDPDAPTETLGAARECSSVRLKAFFERFQNRDDDVDWILAAGILDKKLNVKPDRDLRNVWRVQPVKESPHWKREKAQQGVPWVTRLDAGWEPGIALRTVRSTVNGVRYKWYIPADQMEGGIDLFGILRRNIIIHGETAAGPVRIREGLRYQPLGRETTFRW